MAVVQSPRPRRYAALKAWFGLNSNDLSWIVLLCCLIGIGMVADFR